MDWDILYSVFAPLYCTSPAWRCDNSSLAAQVQLFLLPLLLHHDEDTLMSFDKILRFLQPFCHYVLQNFSLFLLKAHHRALKYPRTIFAGLVIFTLIFGFYTTRLKILFSIQDMVGTGVPTADELTDLKERYEEGTTALLFVVPKNRDQKFTTDELCQIRKWYSFTRNTDPEIKASLSSFDAVWPVEIAPGQVKYENILKLDCSKEPRTGSDLNMVKGAFDSGPWPILKDAKNSFSLMFAFTYKNSQDAKFGSFNPKVVEPLRKTVEKELQPLIPHANLYWVGAADYQWYVLKGFQFSAVVNGAMILFLMIASRFLYGSWLSGFIYCGTLSLAGIWIYGAKALFGSEYDFLSSGLFLIMGIACLEDFTFLSSQQLKGWSWKKSMRELMIPSFLTSLLTMIGFLSLMVSDIGLIADFGLWCALGALLEFAMLYIGLPALLLLFRKNKPIWVNPKKAHLRNWIDTMKVKAIPRWLAKASLIVFPLAAFSFSKINPNDTMSNIFPPEHHFNQGLNELEAAKQWRGSVMIVMEDKYSFAEIEKIATQIKNDPRLEGNVVDYETPGHIVSWLAERKVLTQDQVHDDYFISRARKQLVDKKDVPRALLFVRDVSVLSLQKIKDVGNEICAQRCHMGGDLIAYSDLATEIPKTLVDSMWTSILLVGGVLAFIAIALNRAKHLFVMLLSSFWGPCLMVIMMAVFHIPMDFLKCIFASTLVGLAGDNAIQYIYAADEENLHDGIDVHGGASIQTALLMALTCLLYLGSYFDPPKTFGLIMTAGLVAGLVGDLWLLNGLLPKKDPRS